MIRRRTAEQEALTTPINTAPPSPRKGPLPLFPSSPTRSPRRDYAYDYASPALASPNGNSLGYAHAPHGNGNAPQRGLGYFVEESPPSYVQLLQQTRDNVRQGIFDAANLQRSVGLVLGDPELRTLVLKVTLINLLSLSLLAAFPFVLGPLFHAEHEVETVGFWYNVFISYPIFAACFLINAVWGPRVARRAGGMLHPVHRMQSSGAPRAVQRTSVVTTLTRLLLIADFTLVSKTLALVPFVGRTLATSYMCIVNAYYAYESIFVSRQWPLDYRCSYVSARGAYMFGFGLPATLLTSFGSPLINMAVFALLYPFLLIQALQSRPPAAASLLTPSPAASAPSTPTELGPGVAASGVGPQVPVFVLARHALGGIEWLGQALARERGGSLGGGRRKRPY